MEMNKFKEILQSCHLNFLIGSGTSRPFLGTLGVIETYLTQIDDELDGDFKTIAKVSVLKHYFDVAIKGNYNLLTNSFEKSEIQKSEETKQNYKIFLSAINQNLIRRKGNLINKQANLFTTNVDIFLEKTIEDCGFEYNDGFSGRLNPTFSLSNFKKTISKISSHYDNHSEIPLFNVLKLHGSITWKEITNHKDSQICFDNSLSQIKKLIDNDLINTGEFIELYYDTGKKDEKGIDVWKIKNIEQIVTESKGLILSKNHTKFLEYYEKILMINPTKEKFKFTTLNYTYYELLRMYANTLEKENSVLFVLGFSFADEHIREITVRVANSNPTLQICIFAHSEDSKTSIKSELDKSGSLKFNNIYYFDIPKDGYFDLKTINEKYFEELRKQLEKPEPLN